jgi:hypothetical protein
MVRRVKRTGSIPKALVKRRGRAAASAPNLAEVLRGTLRRRYVRCGKPTCHCKEGRGHGPFLYLSVSLGVGRVEQITIPPEEAGVARQFVQNYRQLHRTLEVISSINRRLLRQRFLKDSLKARIGARTKREKHKKR